MEDLDSFLNENGIVVPEDEDDEDEDDGFSELWGVKKTVASMPFARQARTPDTPGPVTTVGGMLSRFYALESEELAKVQTALHAARFYPTKYYNKRNPATPQLGVHDEDSYKAYRDSVLRAARRQWAMAMGEEETPAPIGGGKVGGA